MKPQSIVQINAAIAQPVQLKTSVVLKRIGGRDCRPALFIKLCLRLDVHLNIYRHLLKLRGLGLRTSVQNTDPSEPRDPWLGSPVSLDSLPSHSS